MHSGYGEMQQQQQQQFMVDGCPPNSFFSISPPPATSSIQNQQKFYQLPTHQPQHHHHHQPLPPPPQFYHHIHPVPITQQLFHPHPFQLFHHHHHHHHSQLGMEHKSPLDNSSSPAPVHGPSSFLDSVMSFKLGVDDTSTAAAAAAAGSGDNVLHEDHDVHVLHGDDGTDGSRFHSWRRDEEEAPATVKQPFWRALDRDYINRNNKRPTSPENNTPTSGTNCSKKSREDAVFLDRPNHSNTARAVTDSNYKLFSELEAIYKPGSNDSGTPNNNQTGSGSVLTGDENNPIHFPGPAICPVAINTGTEQYIDHVSDSSDGGDAMPPPSSTNKSQKASSRRKQRAKRRQQKQTTAITAFFESLMKQVMDHQESLHCKFLQVMEKNDQERASREEASRKEAATRSAREEISRAQERALAASREAAIVSFLEKITGESLKLPVAGSHKLDQECNAMELYNGDCGNNSISSTAVVQLSNNRWPKTEVQALIHVRSGLEPRFQEPGLKGPLWEEVSSAMETMGYRRSAKRCKEKWENINKYFRKTKDSDKKRSQQSKTCPYFQQLDQLYSKSGSAPPSSSNAGVENEELRKDNNNSELLDAIVVSNDHQSFKFPEMGSDQGNEVGSSALAGKGCGNYEDEDGNGDRRDDGEEGEGDSQLEQGGHEHQHFCEGGEVLQHDSTFYFQRLRC